MKRFFMIAAVVLLTIGMTSCGKDDDNTSQTPTNPENPSTPGNPSNPSNFTNIGKTHGEWIDLGLPSGLLWYSVNLGATSPEQYGAYLAWGETSTKDTYSWSTYHYATVDADGDLLTLTRYNTSTDLGTIDNKTIPVAADDAATTAIGNGARIPTQAEWQELLDNSDADWTTVNDVSGCKLTSLANGASLFLPAAGYRYDSDLRFVDELGIYWSSSLYTVEPFNAWDMYFDSDGQDADNNDDRIFGLSVRAVHSPSQN